MRQWQTETMYGQAGDWVFASNRLRGEKPRVANMIVEDFLRPAAVQAKVMEDCDRRRFGFHTLRHSLPTFLATCAKEDPATVQGLLRHADVHTTLQLYAHAGEGSHLAAVDTFMAEFTQSGDAALTKSG
jgi:integrase